MWRPIRVSNRIFHASALPSSRHSRRASLVIVASVSNGDGFQILRDSHIARYKANSCFDSLDIINQHTPGVSEKLRRRAVLYWQHGLPCKALVVKKRGCDAALRKLCEIADWLQARGVEVLVEAAVHEHECPQYTLFDEDHHSKDIDFCVTLGGDGTVLHLASLFTRDEALPPMINFAMGTLGFLTPFDVHEYPRLLTRVLRADQDPLLCTLRMRKTCSVFDGSNRLLCTHHVLNECAIDRGLSPSLIHLECFIDGDFVTTVNADGLIIATPSGSTAYSMSAGGSMVAPSVAATLLTPIAPLSLSFRPLVVPESSDIIVQMANSFEHEARASFDGRHTVVLRAGTSIRFNPARCPLPVINMSSFDRDWYESITQKLHWNHNLRPEHKPPPQLPDLPVPDVDSDDDSHVRDCVFNKRGRDLYQRSIDPCISCLTPNCTMLPGMDCQEVPN